MFKQPGFGLDDIESHIDLTPLIDVIFMLLIFFVLAGTFSKPVLDLLLPKAKTAASASGMQEKELVVSIDKDGSIMCQDRHYGLENLAELVTLQPELRLNLHVDERAPFKPFIALIDEVRAVDRTNVVITADKPKDRR